MLDKVDTAAVVTPISMKQIAAPIEDIDRRNNSNNNSDKALLLFTKFQFTVSTDTTHTLMTSSPTSTDGSSEEFDASMDDDEIVEDNDTETDDIQHNHDGDDNTNQSMVIKSKTIEIENEILSITEQPSGIDTSEIADRSVSSHTPLKVATNTTTTDMIPKRSNLIHSIEESRKSRSIRPRDSRAVDGKDDLLSQPQLHQVEASVVDTTNVPKLTVQFSTVTVRDFPRAMGDNPASSCGPSISIGWRHESECTVPLEEYEENRGPRRCGREMIIPVPIREALLREAGYSRAEIMKGVRDINIIRGQRRRTYETLHLQSFQLLTERISRKAWNVLTLGKNKRKERAKIQELSPPTPHRTSSTTGTGTAPIKANRSSPTTTTTVTTSTSNDNMDDGDDSLSSSFA